MPGHVGRHCVGGDQGEDQPDQHQPPVFAPDAVAGLLGLIELGVYRLQLMRGQLALVIAAQGFLDLLELRSRRLSP